MTGKRKASDDAPRTSRPPAPRWEAEGDGEDLSPSAYLTSGDSGSDGEQSTRVVVPPPPLQDSRVMNVMDAYRFFLQKQERELSVNLRLRGRAARDYAHGLSDGGSAAGEENEASSPWRFVALSELIVPQSPAADQPASPAAQADHSVSEAARAPTRYYACGPSDAGSAAGEENELLSPWKFVRLSELIVPQPPAADQSAAERTEICGACRRWRAAVPWIPYKHFCLCVTCRRRPPARISCWVCGAGRRTTDRP